MEIIQLVSLRQRRGAEVFATELADALQSRGHSVTVLGLQPPPSELLHPRLAAGADLAVPGKGLLDPRRVRSLARFLGERDPAVVQANGGFAMKYAVAARGLARGRWPIVYRNIGLSSDWLRKPGQRLWNRWLMRQVEATATVSEASRTDLIRTYRLDPSRVRVMRRGVPIQDEIDREVGRAALRATAVPDDAFVMIHVGSFTAEKNHLGLLRIAERVRARVGGARLVLVGDGPLAAEVATAAPAWVHQLGLRRDVSTLMAGADVFVLPSRTEGLPGVILEAAAQRLPSVAYDVGGVGEVVNDGVTGILIGRDDEEAIAAAIVDLSGDPSVRQALGAAARRLVCDSYSLERSTDAFEALYTELSGR